MTRKVLRELSISLIMGFVPCLIAYDFSGISGVEEYLESINPPETTVYYFALLSMFQLLVSLSGRWAPRYFELVRKSFRFLYEVANEVGTSLLCVYRLITGSALGCSFIAFTSFPNPSEFKYGLVFAVAALPFLWACVVISDTHNHAKGQQLA